MNIDLRNNCIEAVVPVMVAFDKNKFAIQPLFKLTVFLYAAFFSAFKDEITQKKDCIIGFNSFVMLANDRFIHFLNRLKRPFAIANDIEVRKMII